MGGALITGRHRLLRRCFGRIWEPLRVGSALTRLGFGLIGGGRLSEGGVRNRRASPAPSTSGSRHRVSVALYLAFTAELPAKTR